MNIINTKSQKLKQTLLRWFDTYDSQKQENTEIQKQIDWLRTIPFVIMHLAALLVFVVGWSPIALVIAVVLYALRMFAITAFYHRYFSHKAFKTSRPVQFIFAVIGASAVQRGPLWWAAHHRLHHANADKANDEHSPKQHGFLWSHMVWFLSRHNFATRLERISDFARYPELRFIDRFDTLIPVLLAVSLYIFGEWLASAYPQTGTNGLQMLIWGFVISTLALYHITFTINSLAHSFGKQRFKTRDDSRNNWLLAILTFGEGWHNNHHFYPGSARQGFTWWEVDFTFYGLKVLQTLGLIHDLRPVPDRVKRIYQNHASSKLQETHS